jgi:hypothetical protein
MALFRRMTGSYSGCNGPICFPNSCKVIMAALILPKQAKTGFCFFFDTPQGRENFN